MQYLKNTLLGSLLGCGLAVGLLTAVMHPAGAAMEVQTPIISSAMRAPAPITPAVQVANGSSATLDSVAQSASLQSASLQSTSIEPASVQPAQAVTAPDLGNQIARYHDPAVSALQPRLQPYLKHPDPATAYQAQKANTWLLYAASEYAERGATRGARNDALAQATRIIEGLEQQQTLATTTPILSVSKVMRRDLWANAELLKQHDGFECAAPLVAQAEVMLVWAAAEHCELGWRHSRELFASAERLIDQATHTAMSCKADSPKQLPQVQYPSLTTLNGTRAGCHGVLGQWPMIASPDATNAPAAKP